MRGLAGGAAAAAPTAVGLAMPPLTRLKQAPLQKAAAGAEGEAVGWSGLGWG